MKILTDIALLLLIPLWALIYIQQYSTEDLDGMRQAYIVAALFLTPVLAIYAIARTFSSHSCARILNVLALTSICFYSFSFIDSVFPDLRYREQLVAWLVLFVSIVIAFDRLNTRRAKKLIVTIIAFLYVSLIPPFLPNILLADQSGKNRVSTVTGQNKSNVYFFLLDGYGRSDVLKRQIGYDNNDFINTIKGMNFVVADNSFANYPVTTLSQGSMLDMNYLVKTGPDVLKTEQSYAPIYRYIRGDHSSARFFKKYGYRYVHYWPSAACEYNVDVCAAHKAFLSAPTTHLLALTPLGKLIWLIESREDQDRLKQSVQKALGADPSHPEQKHDIQNLERIISELPKGKPFFLFARILAPHPGNSYGKNCSFVDPSFIVEHTNYHDNQKYISDTQCAERDIVALIEKIKRTDKNNPVIVLQSDHGPEERAQFGKKIADWDKEDIIERFGSLSAIHMSGECVHKYAYPTISNVNTLRLVTACMADSVPEFLPDTSYFSTYRGRPEHGMVVPIAKDSIPMRE